MAGDLISITVNVESPPGQPEAMVRIDTAGHSTVLRTKDIEAGLALVLAEACIAESGDVAGPGEWGLVLLAGSWCLYRPSEQQWRMGDGTVPAWLSEVPFDLDGPPWATSAPPEP